MGAEAEKFARYRRQLQVYALFFGIKVVVWVARWVSEYTAVELVNPRRSFKYKIVYLEHIERLTPGAANMLLKAFEEPLPGRMIIASTTQLADVLDTIRSRAFLVPMQPVSPNLLTQQIQTTYPHLSTEMRQFIAAFSL